ncbi:MAG: hypothetical protein LBT03_01920 [Holosporales bacterium]|nr:hypothetical protein [Holosporales bacterium]
MFFCMTDCFVCSYKDDKLVELETIQNYFATVDDLVRSPEKLKFISAHLLLEETNQSFDEFVTKIGQDNFAEIFSIEKKDEVIIGSLKKTKIKITGIFWHEDFIFEFLNSIYDFRPGFLKISQIDVDKFADISIEKPAMKLEAICEVFQKQ